jgi:hypothetical protein
MRGPRSEQICSLDSACLLARLLAYGAVAVHLLQNLKHFQMRADARHTWHVGLLGFFFF